MVNRRQEDNSENLYAEMHNMQLSNRHLSEA